MIRPKSKQFEEAFRDYEFAPLVELALVLGAWIRGILIKNTLNRSKEHGLQIAGSGFADGH